MRIRATGDGASTRAIPIEPTSFRLTHNSAGLVVSSKVRSFFLPALLSYAD